MTGRLAGRVGHALTWKVIQLGATKGLFLVRTLILARLLSPGDFGLLAIATVAVGFVMTITELGMAPALVHQREVDEAHYNSAWTVNVVRALFVSGALLAAAPAIATLFAEPRATDLLRFLALKPLIDASASIKVIELTRRLDYRRRAFVYLPAVIVETVVSILLARPLGVWALVTGALTGAMTLVVASYILAPHRPRVVLAGRTLRPLVRYGRWVFLIGLTAASANSLTQMVISRQLGVVELGLYVLAAKLAFLPHELAGQVVGDVTFSLYARIQDDRMRVAKAFRSVLLSVSSVLLPVYLLLISLAPRLVADVLGERWLGTVPLIQLLAVAGMLGLFGDTTGPVFRGLGYPNWILSILVWQSSLVILLLWSLTSRYGALGAALAWLIAGGSSQVISFILARRLIGNPMAGSGLPLAVILLAAAAGTVAATAVIQFVPGIAGLLVATSAAFSGTVMVLWWGDRRFGLGLRTNLSEAFPRVATIVGLAPATR